MKIFRQTLVLISAGLALQSAAQQSPLFGFTSQILQVTNPAMSKTASPLNVTLAGRKYWTGIPNGPEAYIGAVSVSPGDYKSALGLYAWKEKSPLISKQVTGLNYAYAIKSMEEKTNLRMGIGLDFISVNSNTSSILTDDYSDPYYLALFNNNRSSVDFRAGAVLNVSDFEIGASVQEVVKSKNNIGDASSGKLWFDNSMITNGHLKYNIRAGEKAMISPMVFWQYQKSVPLRIDINILAEKTGVLWGGAWLRPNAAMGVMGGLWILPEVKLGYMYERTFFKSMTGNGNSHELIVTYTPAFMKAKEEPEKPEIVYTNPPAPEVVHVVDTLVIIKETRITETPKETPPAPKPSETVSMGNYYVITGLFGVKENADKLARKLKAEGFSPKLVKNKPKEQFYVTVGKFETEEAAREWIARTPHGDYTFWVKQILD